MRCLFFFLLNIGLTSCKLLLALELFDGEPWTDVDSNSLLKIPKGLLLFVLYFGGKDPWKGFCLC